jgi:hypothetical protein
MIGGHRRQVGKAASEGYIDTVNIRQVFIETVIARFKMDVLKNKKTGRHPDGQSKNINQRIYSILDQVPVSDCKIAPEHSLIFLLKDQSKCHPYSRLKIKHIGSCEP